MRFLRQVQDTREDSAAAALGLAGLRVSGGALIFVFHGVHKLEEGLSHLRYGTPWKLAEEVADMGAPAAVATACLATLVQFVGALLLIAGWHTRINALLLAGVLGGAVLQNLLTGRDPQLALVYTLVTAAFVLLGGGRYSLDARRWAPAALE